MNDERHKKLVEASWRRPLTPSEEAEVQFYLAAHPDKQLEWEDDQALSSALQALPNAPLSSNFTAQVLQAIDREERAAERQAPARLNPYQWLRRWLPRFAPIAAMLMLALASLNYYQMRTRDAAMGAVGDVAPFVAVFPPEVLENFDAIQQLRTAPDFSEEELVAVLLR